MTRNDMFTVNNALTGSRYGKVYFEKEEAEQEAVKISKTVTHTIDVILHGDNTRKIIGYAHNGVFTAEQ